jgi:predicted TIM-barrel fold metal-dependent hydrolase
MKQTSLLAVVVVLMSSLTFGQATSKKVEQKPYHVFDAHLHALPPELFVPAAGASFWVRGKMTNTNITNPDLLLKKTIEYMDNNNVRSGLLSGANAMVQSWAKAYPDRFYSSFSPDLSIKDHRETAKQFEKEVEEGKWRAIGELVHVYAGLALNDSSFFPYYEVCERKDIPVFFHTGLDGPEPQRLVSPLYRVELADPLLLQDVVIRFPKLKVVIMHMGWPFFDHALFMMYSYPNVYLDVAAVNWMLGSSVFKRMLVEAIETVGNERILFGSDQMVWPQMITSAVRSITEADFLNDVDKRRILWENAKKLLNLDGKVAN